LLSLRLELNLQQLEGRRERNEHVENMYKICISRKFGTPKVCKTDKEGALKALVQDARVVAGLLPTQYAKVIY
jgi:hypothetical protein